MSCPTEVVVERGSLAVLRCACGNLQLRVGHVSVGFDRKGFVAMAALVGEALPNLDPADDPTRALLN